MLWQTQGPPKAAQRDHTSFKWSSTTVSAPWEGQSPLKKTPPPVLRKCVETCQWFCSHSFHSPSSRPCLASPSPPQAPASSKR